MPALGMRHDEVTVHGNLLARYVTPLAEEIHASRCNANLLLNRCVAVNWCASPYRVSMTMAFSLETRRACKHNRRAGKFVLHSFVQQHRGGKQRSVRSIAKKIVRPDNWRASWTCREVAVKRVKGDKNPTRETSAATTLSARYLNRSTVSAPLLWMHVGIVLDDPYITDLYTSGRGAAIRIAITCVVCARDRIFVRDHATRPVLSREYTRFRSPSTWSRGRREHSRLRASGSLLKSMFAPGIPQTRPPSTGTFHRGLARDFYYHSFRAIPPSSLIGIPGLSDRAHSRRRIPSELLRCKRDGAYILMDVSPTELGTGDIFTARREIARYYTADDTFVRSG